MASALMGSILSLSAYLARPPAGPAWPALALAAASATPLAEPALPTGTSAVRISAGEAGMGLVASWLLPAGAVLGEGITVTPTSVTPTSVTPTSVTPTSVTPTSVTPTSAGSLPGASWSSAVRPGASAVALPSLARGTYRAMVTVVTATGTRQIGPSPSFAAGPSGGQPAPDAQVLRSAAAPLPCQGSTFGVGAVTVDGWAGYQGSYCLPPAFTGGTGAFCIDHGLDYPFGGASYGWQETVADAAVAGAAVALVNQYDETVPPVNVARLNWILANWGSTADPARATAIGVITHAIMGDYPGLSIAQLDPPTFQVTGGDPGAIAADEAQMWGASASAGAPYHVSITLAPGPLAVGRMTTGTLQVTAQGGAPVAGEPISFSASVGVSVLGDQPVRTDANGELGFRFTPLAASFRLAASTPDVLPGTGVEVWSPTAAGVPTQRVVTVGPTVAAAGSLTLSAQALGQATLVKVSADAAVPVGPGFRFEVQRVVAGGGSTLVAQLTTSPDGTMRPMSDLSAGSYQVTEEAAPAAFVRGGPWHFVLAAGQRTTWTVTDQARPVPVQVIKSGNNPVAQPIGAGVKFSLTPDGGSTPASGANPVATWITGVDGRSAAQGVAPGRYLLSELTPPAGYRGSSPVVVVVPAATTTTPATLVVHVNDTAVPGTIVLRKIDARTGLLVAGARLRISGLDGRAPSVGPVPVGTWTSATTPVEVAGLLAGTYTVTEQSAPPGYQLATVAAEQVVLEPGETLQVTFADQRVVRPAPRPKPKPTPRPTPTTIAAATAVAAAPAVAPGPVLAFTGSPSVQLVGWALVLAGAGVGLVGLAQRGRRRVP